MARGARHSDGASGVDRDAVDEERDGTGSNMEGDALSGEAEGTEIGGKLAGGIEKPLLPLSICAFRANVDKTRTNIINNLITPFIII